MVFAALTMLFLRGDAFKLNAAQDASAAYTFDLVGWHLANSMSKWTHRAARAIPGRGISDANRLALVDEYFRLGRIENDLKREIQDVVSQDAALSAKLVRVQTDLERVHRLRHDIRGDVEEALESEVSFAARARGLGLIGEIVFPPVDVRLTDPPKALITSPRDRIERLDGVLLDPHMSVENREEIETRLLETDDLSALVLDIGGVATYPASIFDDGDLRATLSITAHEWLHHYLFFRPLGQNMDKSSDMLVLNETVADLGGRELGDIASESIGARMPATIPAALDGISEMSAANPTPARNFDFSREMRETRRTVDRLLAEGHVEKAEAYMETRRRLFVANGHPIRKLNQAYFAFNGTYAESAASVNPIGGQVRRLREMSPDFGAFLALVSGVSGYAEFLKLLREAEIAE